MAHVSYLRESGNRRTFRRGRGGLSASQWRGGPARRGPGRYVALGLVVVVVAALVVAGVALARSKASLTTDPAGIAKVNLPLGGGTIQSVSVVTGPHSTAVDVALSGSGHVITPSKPVPAGSRMLVQVVVRRPGWIAWLSGGTQRLNLTVTTPTALPRSDYVTVAGSAAPVRVHFTQPISAYAYGASPRSLHHHVLSRPTTTVVLPRTSSAGTMYVSATPRAWEHARAVAVSWFPAGGAATAVATPAPGAHISSMQPITLTFSKPVSSAIGTHLPPVAPATQGTWQTVNSHTIQFRPAGYGYGLGATVKVALPSAVHLIGGQHSADASNGTWSVPAGTTLRLQEILATLGYLPVTYHAAGGDVPLTAQAQEAAAVTPPRGSFAMRYPNTPAWLVGDWASGIGHFGELTKAAVMAFEDHAGLAPDGDPGPEVWKALINAVIHNQTNAFGYSVAEVSMHTPESLSLWHNGRTVMTTPVNTGISQSPTAPGTFAVYEHLPVTTMSGTNPDGSHYHDTGIPWVSYFNGGDALHGFIRGSYGTPQSLGCVEMPFAIAGRVYPFTPIGTIVHVT